MSPFLQRATPHTSHLVKSSPVQTLIPYVCCKMFMTETFRKLHYISNKFCEVDYIIQENWMSNAAASRKGEGCEFPESINTAMSSTESETILH